MARKVNKYKPAEGRARTKADLQRILEVVRELTGYEGRKYLLVADGTVLLNRTLNQFRGDEDLEIDVQERVGRSDGWSTDTIHLNLAKATLNWKKLQYDTKGRPFREMTTVQLGFQPVD